MTEAAIPTFTPVTIEPLRYHREMRDFLRRSEPGLWDAISAEEGQAERAEARRLELLKTCVRLEGESHPELLAALAEMAARLGIQAPLRVYQAQQTPEANAMLAFIPGEVHIIFSGPVLAILEAAELRVVLAHELAHYLLWAIEESAFFTASRLLDQVSGHLQAANCHRESARRWSLFTEVFADRAALAATSDLEASVAALVKAETGLAKVSGRSYLQQAEEILAGNEFRTRQLSHPELFIRARALALWHASGDEAEPRIEEMLESVASLDELDWLGQERLSRLTRQFLGQLLLPKWFRSDTALAHARLFFADFTPTEVKDDGVEAEIRGLPQPLRDYFAWILADFARLDRSLEDVPLAAALDWSKRLGCTEAFAKIASADLKIKARELKKLEKSAADLLARAALEK